MITTVSSAWMQAARGVAAFILLILAMTTAAQAQYKTLGEWDNTGIPAYLEPERDEISDAFLERVNAVLPESKSVPESNPDLISTAYDANILIEEEADVWVTFVHEGAGYRNALGFYTYQEGDVPQSVEDIADDLTIIFPNVSYKGSGGGLVSGDKVKIGRFSANTVIAWFVVADGFRDGSIRTDKWHHYSDSHLNLEEDPLLQKHNVLIYDEQSKSVVLGFEDIRRDYGSCDQDFNDVLFYVTANPVEAINYTNFFEIDDPEVFEADLEVIITMPVSTASNGDEFSYAVQVSNIGPDPSEEVTAFHEIPEGLTQPQFQPERGSYDAGTGEWAIGDIDPGEAVTMFITGVIDYTQMSSAAFNFGEAAEYNVFIRKDVYQPSSDTEGKMAAGGDVFLSNYSVGDKLPEEEHGTDVLVVGGNLTFESGRVFHGNAVYRLGTNLPKDIVSIDGELRRESINLYPAYAHLHKLSKRLKDLEPNGIVETNYSELNLIGSDPLLNVFKVNGDSLNAAVGVHIYAPAGSVVLVNVYKNNIEWSGGLTVNGTATTNVLFNFYQALSMVINSIDITGSVLAPHADVEFASGVVNGQFFAKSLTGQAQFNNVKFRGNIPLVDKMELLAEVESAVTPDPRLENNSAAESVDLGGYGSTQGGGKTSPVEWQAIENFGPEELIWSLTFSRTRDMYAGTFGGKVYKRTDREWSDIGEGLNVGYIWKLLHNDGTLYATTERGVYGTTDDGTTWTSVGFHDFDVRDAVYANGLYYMAVWGQGVWTVAPASGELTNISSGLSELAVHALSAAADGTIYAGTFGGGIFRLAPGSGEWEQLDIPYRYIWSLLTAPDGTIYAGTYGGGLYKSADNGDFWTRELNGMPAKYIYSIAAGLRGSIYISGWNAGLFGTNEMISARWQPLGFTGAGAGAVAVDPETGEVYAGVEGGALYSFDGVITSVEENAPPMPFAYELQQNYPNPFNPATTINFSLAEPGHVTLFVYDILGRKVAELVNDRLEAGPHSTSFNASSLASGIYLYRIQAGNTFSASRKMLFLK